MTPKILTENPNNTYELIAVLNIDCYYPHKYKVIFRDISKNTLHQDFLIPEELRSNYIVGNQYKNGKLIFENELKDELTKLRMGSLMSVGKISEFLYSNRDTNLGLFSDEFYNQFCIFHEDDESIFILPLSVIANKYYFLSTEVKKSLNLGSFENICYPNSFKLYNDTANVLVKHALNTSHIPLVAQYLSAPEFTSKFTHFKRTITNAIKNNKKNIPINLDFPFKKFTGLSLEFNYKLLSNQSVQNKFKKPIKVITNIINGNFKYNFNTLNYTQIKREQKEEPTNRFPQETGEKSDKTTTKKPSKRKKSIKKYNHNNNYTNTDDLIINPCIEYKGEIPERYDEKTGEFIDGSENEPDSKDNNTAELLYDDDIEFTGFKIEDFIKLFKELISSGKIKENKISNKIILENHYDNNSAKFYLDSNDQYPRQFIYGYFIYDNKLINFIETQHDDYWKKNTWFIYGHKKLTQSNVQTILNDYIVIHKNIKKSLQNDKHKIIKHFSTIHPTIEENKKSAIEQWCKNVISRIKEL